MLSQIFDPDFTHFIKLYLHQFLAIGYYFIPPIAGGIIGYFTNDLAVQMLFRPYRAWYVLSPSSLYPWFNSQ